MLKIITYSLLLLSFATVLAQKPVVKKVPQKSTIEVVSVQSEVKNNGEPTIIELGESPTKSATTPNSGKDFGKEIPLKGTFSFNKKVGFMVNSSEGNMVSYFYLNTRNGYAMQDHKALLELGAMEDDGEVNQIKSPNNDFYQYIKSSEGNYAMKMGSQQSMVIHDMETKELSKIFFKTFKKTGAKVGKTGGNKYPRVEYSGTYEGKKMSIWLSSSQDIVLDTKFTSSLVGFWGLGFIASPSGKTYMITGIEESGVSIFMTYIENSSFSFSGASYKPAGDVMGAGAATRKNEMNAAVKAMYEAAQNEEDPQKRALMMQQIKNAEAMLKDTSVDLEKFEKSSDIADLPSNTQANNPEATAQYYDMMILQIEQAILEHKKQLRSHEASGYSTGITSSTCMIKCTEAERNRLQKLKSNHIKILNDYKNDEEKRDAKVNELLERSGTPTACNCD
ncbi:hypothetical protein [Flavobacterium sp.]|uniref:hypothetical protein n=1 Tax=Flavobacterium sp. TaxID=239 RepID=UPI002625EDF6|nr:hypothetical protein [Flavobacterium sp.]